MRYFLYEEQGEGCDYTIGCGRRLREIPGVQSLADAWKKVVSEEINEETGLLDDQIYVETRGERAVRLAMIFEVTNSLDINLVLLESEREYKRRQREQDFDTIREKAEYERLKKKFES